MKTKIILLTTVIFTAVVSSCDSILQGVAQGIGNYGAGMYGYPYAATVTQVPYALSDVYVRNVCQQSMAKIQADTKEIHDNIEKMSYGMINQVNPGVYVAPVVNGSSVPSTTSNSSSSSTVPATTTSSSSYRSDCRLCLGTGKCQTCNGNGSYSTHTYGTYQVLPCPNCAANYNGRCASCNGSGKK